MSPAPSLQSIIAHARRALRRDMALAIGAGIAALIPATLLTAWLIGAPTGPSKAPFLIDALAIGLALAILGFAARRWLARINDRNVAAAAETRLGFAEGELQGVIEMQNDVPAGTSKALWQRAERSLAARLAREPVDTLTGAVGADVRRRRRDALLAGGLLALVTIVVAFASPERSRAAWSPLLKPVSTMAAPALPPITVAPGDASIPRGSHLDVQIRAEQRAAAVIYYRQQGDVLQEQTLPVVNGTTSFRIRNVDAATRYWVRTPDGASSDTFGITPTDPLLVAGLSIDVVYPAYLARAPEHFEKDVPPLELPAGTQLRIAGRATQTLRSVALEHELTSVALNVSGQNFEIAWTPTSTGVYTWKLNNDAAAGVQPLDIQVLGDAAPEVEVTFPGVDTLIAPDLRQLIVADARDDYGIVAATLVSWRSTRTGQREPPIEQALMLEGEADQKLVRGVLDATARRLLPGDTLSYFVRVHDNSPARKAGNSRIYTLRIPGSDELRERVQGETDDLIKDADELARALQQLETRTRDLQRKSATSNARQGQRGAGGTPGASPGKQLSNEQVEQARELMERQQAMTSEMETLRDRLEAMEQAAERAGLSDPEMQKQLDEMRKLFDELLSPEMKKQLEAMRKALENLSPEDLQKALEEMAKQQEEMKQQLEQSLEMLRRAATEQELNALSQQARELATQQDALADQMKEKQGDPKQKTEKQEELAKESSKLAEMLSKLRRKMNEQGETAAAGKTGEAQKQTEEARDAMNDAAKESARQNGEQAGNSGEQAADKLNDAAESLENLRKELSKSWKKETQEAVDAATQDAINLAEAQKELLDRMNASARAGNAEQQQQQKQGGQQQGAQTGQKEGSQQGGSKEQGQQEGGKAGQQGAGQKQGGQEGSGGQQGQPGGNMQQLRADQAALKQGLEQLGKNLSEAGQRSAMVNKDVASALARANMAMDQTMRALEDANAQQPPSKQAEQTLDALNKLALELLKNGEQIGQSEQGTGLQQALEQLKDLAKQQGNLNGRSNSLLPMKLSQQVMSQQMSQLAREQRDIAQKLGGMNKGGARDDLLGRLDELVKEADQIARELEGGRMDPQTAQRQERLFHKLLDAGRTMERDEVSEEREAEAARPLPPEVIRALKPGLFENADKFTAPTAEQLRDLPPAYRRLILEYFERLNRVEK